MTSLLNQIKQNTFYSLPNHFTATMQLGGYKTDRKSINSPYNIMTGSRKWEGPDSQSEHSGAAAGWIWSRKWCLFLVLSVDYSGTAKVPPSKGAEIGAIIDWQIHWLSDCVIKPHYAVDPGWHVSISMYSRRRRSVVVALSLIIFLKMS